MKKLLLVIICVIVVGTLFSCYVQAAIKLKSPSERNVPIQLDTHRFRLLNTQEPSTLHNYIVSFNEDTLFTDEFKHQFSKMSNGVELIHYLPHYSFVVVCCVDYLLCI
jgi:ABC-type polysaccharide transport system permease subunit